VYRFAFHLALQTPYPHYQETLVSIAIFGLDDLVALGKFSKRFSFF
jgi:O-phosphoseryl-tRNA(Cys) synthetase